MRPSRKIFRTLLCLTLVLLLLQGCGLVMPQLPNLPTGEAPQTEPTGQGDYTGDMPRFSQIYYERPDLEGISDAFEKLIADLEADNLTAEQGVSRLEEVYDLYNLFYTMDEVAQIRYYHDVTGTRYADESDWFLENEPVMDQLFEELCYASANCAIGQELDESFWGGWTVEAYRGQEPETLDRAYLELAQRENAILTEYRRVTAEASVEWKGEERSFLELQQDASISLEEWNQIRDLYYDEYAPILGEIYLRLVEVRQELAEYMGLESYEDYVYYAVYQRDYSPQEAEQMLEQIKQELAPLYKELSLNRRWDALRYTELNESENLDAIFTAARKMGGTVRNAFRDMERYELYDIDISDKKADLSYQCYLYTYDNPFVFVKTEGYSDDILSFGHEFGHFVDAWYNRDATDSHDLSEVFSQSMEYLLLSYVPEDYREELTTYKLLDTVDTFTQQGSYAAFEHEVYSKPASEWSPEALNELSLKLSKDFGYYEPGDDNFYAKSWVDINHLFESPFYVVSYCASNDPAFQIYALECGEPGAGLEVWNRMLPRDYDGFLDTVMEQGGLEDPFAPDRMARIAALLREKLN